MLKRFVSRKFASAALNIKLDRTTTRKMSSIDVIGDSNKIMFEVPVPNNTKVELTASTSFK